MASWNGYVEIVRTLVDRGADVNIKDNVSNDDDNYYDDDYDNGCNYDFDNDNECC